jgi:hypothetical protein
VLCLQKTIFKSVPACSDRLGFESHRLRVYIWFDLQEGPRHYILHKPLNIVDSAIKLPEFGLYNRIPPAKVLRRINILCPQLVNANLAPSSVLGVLQALERSITYCVHWLIKLKLVVRIIRLIVRVKEVAV